MNTEQTKKQGKLKSTEDNIFFLSLLTHLDLIGPCLDLSTLSTTATSLTSLRLAGLLRDLDRGFVLQVPKSEGNAYHRLCIGLGREPFGSVLRHGAPRSRHSFPSWELGKREVPLI
ncbi:unnamed protein product [Linum trigynum]|uniref:Uncharacterized protein n=1 Tax=Linum trigynum TaxID=586398 RepID=A0AAV2DTA1_9ROSI